jgi:hypothetical protein
LQSLLTCRRSYGAVREQLRRRIRRGASGADGGLGEVAVESAAEYLLVLGLADVVSDCIYMVGRVYRQKNLLLDSLIPHHWRLLRS